MEKIREVIVVEGKNDTKRLRSFFDVETIETHGLGLSKETLQFISEVNQKRGVILFLDPDSPGEKIRQRINDFIPGCRNAFLLKEDARTSKKVGIEHAAKEVLQEALEHIVTYGDPRESLSEREFLELGLSSREDSQIRRDKISKAFHIGKCNAKTMLKRCNLLGITAEDLKGVL